MKIIYRIALAELQSLFYSPVAWLILIVFTIQCSLHSRELWMQMWYESHGVWCR
ncbi:MAG: hypothetical protein ACLTZT_07090 [Butyricimonas faecalis]